MPEEAHVETSTEEVQVETSTEETGSILTAGAGAPTTTEAVETSSTGEGASSTKAVEVKTTEVAPETMATADWAKSLPEDFEGLESLKKFTSLEELAKGYVHAESLIGREKIPMPTNDEEMATTLKRLGAVETVDELGLQLPENVDERFKGVFQQDLDWFGQAAVDNNLTKKQVENLYKSYSEYQGEQLKVLNDANAAAKSESMVLIQREHGDQYEQVIHNASRVLNEFGDQALKETLDETGLGNNPGLVRLLNRIAPLIGEETAVDKAPAQTLAQLDQELNEAYADPAYLDKSSPMHKAAKEKVTKLMQQRYPA